MSIQVQSIAASRTTTPASETAYVATPLSFVMTLTGSDTFATHEAIFLEIHECREDHEAGELPLAYASTSSPTGTSQTLAFTSAQLDFTFTTPQKEYWVVIYVTGPGDVLLPLWECSLTLRNVHVSLRTCRRDRHGQRGGRRDWCPAAPWPGRGHRTGCSASGPAPPRARSISRISRGMACAQGGAIPPSSTPFTWQGTARSNGHPTSICVRMRCICD